MHKKYFIYLLILSYNFYTAQSGFRTRYIHPGAYDQATQSIFELPNGSFVGAGTIIDTSNGKFKWSLMLLGINIQGDVIWQKKFSHPWLSWATSPWVFNSFYQTKSHLYFAGVENADTVKPRGLIIKFDFDGNLIWKKTYSDAEDVVFQAISESVDNGLLITGWFQNWQLSTQPSLLFKTDTNGNELWRKRYNFNNIPNTSEFNSIVQDSATKKIILAGSQNNVFGGTDDFLLITDSMGNYITSNNYKDGRFQHMIQCKDKSLLLVSVSAKKNINGVYDYYGNIMKLNLNMHNQPIWRIDDYGKPSNSFARIVEKKNGDVLIGGGLDTMTWINPNFDATLRYTILSGGKPNLKNYYYHYSLGTATINNMGLTSMQLTKDGGVVVGIIPQNANHNPFFFVKYDANGCDTLSNYCNLVGLEELEISNNLLRIYPNPSQNTLNVEFENNFDDKNYTVKIVDELLRSYTSLSVTSSNKLNLDLSKLSNGIYFLQVWNDEQLIYTKKFVKN